MKVKCINAGATPVGEKLTLGKEYEVIGSCESSYIIENEYGHRLGYMKSRFVEIKSLEEQLEEAKALVEDLEEQIENNKIKIGDKYKHRCGNIYMITTMGTGWYIPVCIKGDSMGYTYGVTTFESPEDCFGGNEEFFTKVD